MVKNMVRVCKMRNFNIYSNFHGGYIVHNTREDFAIGHTHINSYKTAKYVAYLALYKKMPKNHHLSSYLIQSVIRISDDTKYICKMQQMLKTVNQKKGKD